MEELLKSLGIDETAGAEVIVEKLELKQSEIMERLDNVEDEKRKQKLEDDLMQIEAAIEAFSWMRGKKQTGIAREERKKEITAEQGSIEAKNKLPNMGSKEQVDAKTAAAATRPAPASTSTYTKSTASASTSTYTKSTAPAPTPTYTKNKPSVSKGGKFIKRLCISVLIIMAIGSACPSYIENSGIEMSFVRCFSPNILYAEEHVGSTPSPWYISLRPMKRLQIDKDAKNMSYVIVPFGAKWISIEPAIKKINIPDGTEYVSLNCERLEELILPDSVTELNLYNVKKELALSLKYPEHLKHSIITFAN